MCFVYPKPELTLNFHSGRAPRLVRTLKTGVADKPSTPELRLDPKPAKAESGSDSELRKSDLALLHGPANLAWTAWYERLWSKSAVLQEITSYNWDLAADRLSELQTGRLSLKHAVRALSEDLQTLDFFISSGSNAFVVEAKANAAADAQLGVSTSMGAVGVIDGQHRYTLQEEVWDYLLSAARRNQGVLKQALTVVRRIQNWVSAAILLLIQQLFRFACSLFCSVRWERRRWFLCHTAHPPKISRPAVAGLLLGACFGSPLA
jgi:hypothetical protein